MALKIGKSSYPVPFSMLKAFEEGLHLHIHLENNVLQRPEQQVIFDVRSKYIFQSGIIRTSKSK